MQCAVTGHGSSKSCILRREQEQQANAMELTRWEWCSWWYCLNLVATGTTIGQLDATARILFQNGFLRARKWLISCCADNRFWLQVPLTVYATTRTFHQGRFRT